MKNDYVRTNKKVHSVVFFWFDNYLHLATKTKKNPRYENSKKKVNTKKNINFPTKEKQYIVTTKTKKLTALHRFGWG